MLETIMDRNLPLYCMAALCATGVVGMFTTHLSYRRMIRRTKDKKTELREKWMDIWRTRDGLLAGMNRFVWYPSLLSILLLGLAVYLNANMRTGEGLSLNYLYLGAAIPVILLLFRQGLDFTYREELLMNSLKDYVEYTKVRESDGAAAEDDMEDPNAIHPNTVHQSTIHPNAIRQSAGHQSAVHVSDPDVVDKLQREAAVEHITESIRQTAAAGSHFRNMLTPEEEEIMRDIIREFLD